MQTHKLRRLTIIAALSVSFMLIRAVAQQHVIDASHQPAGPARGRGPFPASDKESHSAGFPIRLAVEVPSGGLRQDGSVLIDFILTNVGSSPISLPSSVNQNATHTAVLTLYVTSDGMEPSYFVNGARILLTPTCAELLMESNDPDTSFILAPNESIRVHTSSRWRFRSGVQTVTGHAELLKLVEDGRGGLSSEEIGTADSDPVRKVLSSSNTAR